MNNIFWAADSTVQTNDITTYPQTGIGQVFSLYLREGYSVVNHAKNGRSTKSFMEEGRLSAIDEKIAEGDFLFIQFGHNDEKIHDPARYTEPFSSYKENLKTFIETARKHGAYPVLITPLERRCFEENGCLGKGEHEDYVQGMKQTAQETQTPLVDLYTMSREALQRAGEVETRKWYMNLEPGKYKSCPEGKTDNTHLKYEGAVIYAGLIAEGLKKLDEIYRSMLVE